MKGAVIPNFPRGSERQMEIEEPGENNRKD